MFTRRTTFLLLTIVASSTPFAVATRGQANGPSTLFQWYYEEASGDGSRLDEPLVTDRPDFTEASTTVGQGVVQLETGYTFTSDAADGVRTANHSFPETLLRVGILADWLEFRVDWNYEIERTRAGGVATTRSGADDLTLGFKIALTEQQCNLPETAIILQLSVPTGGDAFTADEVLTGVNYLYSWELNDDWSLGASTGITGAVDDETNDTYGEFSQSVTLGHSWNEKVGSYTEWYVLSPIRADTNRPQNYFNVGMTYLINKDVQWDIRAGVGLNEAADNFFVGTGLSLRYY